MGMTRDRSADNARRRFAEAIAQLNTGNVADAEAGLAAVLKLDPAHFGARYNLGVAALKSDQPSRALDMLEGAIALHPRQADAHNLQGFILNLLKRHDEAIAAFDRALKLQPDFRAARINRDTAVADRTQWLLVDRYRDRFGTSPRLFPPVSFNERILHRILFDRDTRLKIVCDKLAVRKAIETTVGSRYVVPVLGVWQDPQAINWKTLPRAVVLKPNHTSGDILFLDQSAVRDRRQLTAALAHWLTFDYFDKSLEWGYRGLPRRILAEPVLRGTAGGILREVQVFTFAGRGKIIRCWTGTKFGDERVDMWLDRSGREVAVNQDDVRGKIPIADAEREELLRVAETIAATFSFLRVDFYLTDAGPKICELSAYPNGAMNKWECQSLDDLLGRLWDPDFDGSEIPSYVEDA